MDSRDPSLPVVEALLHFWTRETATREPHPARPPFSITISRQVGTQGSRVADQVGRQLGWAVYDRAILDQVARQLRRPPSHVQGIDERPVSWLEDCLAGLLDRSHVSPDAYLKYLIGAVRGLGEVGRCVIVGRGANFILPAVTTLRVRLVAPLQERVGVVARRQSLSSAAAAALVETRERERVEFVKRSFLHDPESPEHYDVVLNTSRLVPDEAAVVILAALARLEAHGSREGHMSSALR
jgi:cytidylate kinase